MAANIVKTIQVNQIELRVSDKLAVSFYKENGRYSHTLTQSQVQLMAEICPVLKSLVETDFWTEMSDAKSKFYADQKLKEKVQKDFIAKTSKHANSLEAHIAGLKAMGLDADTIAKIVAPLLKVG